MAPRAQRPRSPRPKPARTVRVHRDENGLVMLCTTEVVGRQVKTTNYFLRRIDSDFGQGFELLKSILDGGERYCVNIATDPAQDTCECPGHLRWGFRTVCRHRAMLRALLEKGRV